VYTAAYHSRWASIGCGVQVIDRIAILRLAYQWRLRCIHHGLEFNHMKNTILKLYVNMQVLKNAFVNDERGQDLVEYALVVSLIALGATASMSSLATSFSTAFSKVGSKLSTYTS
jgi:pilus assembly protein Flp/PilA